MATVEHVKYSSTEVLHNITAGFEQGERKTRLPFLYGYLNGIAKSAEGGNPQCSQRNRLPAALSDHG